MTAYKRTSSAVECRSLAGWSRWRTQPPFSSATNSSRRGSKHRTLGGYQQIDMRPREACVRSRTAKGAVVKSPEMILPKNALSSVDESTKLLDETYWCRSIIVCVATLKPPYRT